ncbi:MAG: methyltransferase [Bacteroidetes bacterium]|nr:methyltransferase [Bacteroidota bacterium]
MIEIKEIKDLKKYNVFLYGAGNIGKQIYSVLVQNGIQIDSVFDKFASSNNVFEVINPFVDNVIDTDNSIIIVTIFNRDVNYNAIKKELNKLGFTTIVSIIEIFPIFSEYDFNWFWLSTNLTYLKDADLIKDLFVDEKSKEIYSQIVEARKSYSYEKLPCPENIQNQYFSEDVPWSPIGDFIDLGAYDGDTIDSILTKKITFDRIIAFEPDLKNFNILSEKVRSSGIHAMLYPCGTYSRTTQISFSNDGSEGSKIDPSINTFSSIQCVALDDIFNNCLNQNTYIKMDIEGAELDTLKGCQKLIKKYKPKLAVCLYHKPEDIITIPKFLHEIHSYKFYVRQYGFYGLETVLYAIP